MKYRGACGPVMVTVQPLTDRCQSSATPSQTAADAYGFAGDEAYREVQDLRERLDAGEPVDERILGPLAKRADEADLRRRLSEYHSDDEVERLMEVHRELRGE